MVLGRMLFRWTVRQSTAFDPGKQESYIRNPCEWRPHFTALSRCNTIFSQRDVARNASVCASGSNVFTVADGGGIGPFREREKGTAGSNRLSQSELVGIRRLKPFASLQMPGTQGRNEIWFDKTPTTSGNFFRLLLRISSSAEELKHLLLIGASHSRTNIN